MTGTTTLPRPSFGKLAARMFLALLACQPERIQSFSGPFQQRRPRSHWQYGAQVLEATSALRSSLSDDGDFALIGLNAEAPLNPSFDVTSTQASSFGLQSAEDIAVAMSEQAPQKKEASQNNNNNSQQQQQDLAGLTADGDFILEGVNAIDPSASRGVEKYGTPLIGGQGGDTSFLSQLSAVGDSQEPTSSSSDNSMTGLTEDGDIALVGFNTRQPTSPPNEMDQEKLLASFVQRPPLSSSEASISSTVSMTPSRVVTAPPPENSEEEVEDMTMWLQDLIPTLQDEDCIYYAEQLLSLGFHPNCVTQCELRLADLATFMKPLHARYLFHELKGIPHPPKQLDQYDYELEKELYDAH